MKSNLKVLVQQNHKAEQKNVHTQIKQGEEKYRTLIERISDAFFSLDKNFCYTYINKKGRELIQRDLDSIIGKNVWDEFPASVGTTTYHALNRAMKEQRYVCNVDYFALHDAWVENHIYPSLEGVVIFVRDITAQTKANEELRRSNERFQYATLASSDIIWELNFETKQYLVHEGREKLFGPGSIINWQMGVEGKYIVEEDREQVKKSFRRARMDVNCTRWKHEYRVSRGGSVMYIINHAVFIRNANGKAIRVFGAITDITERKMLELELLEQQRKEQLKITATALEAQEKERNFIGQELHDNVNQILVGANLTLTMAKEDSDAKNQVLIDAAMKNLHAAIEQNRTLSHQLITPDLQLDSLARQLSDLAHSMLEASGVKTLVNSSLFHEESLSDAQKIAIYRIAQEQCTNIVKYAKARNVIISLCTADGIFNMLISDDGQGMEEGKTTKGIGLRNINTRVSIFHGIASIKTSPGKGFTLEIEMPVRVEE